VLVTKRIHKLLSRKKLRVFGLFFLLSFSILLLTKLSQDYTHTVKFAIDKINIPEEQVIIGDSSHYLEITLKTYGFKLARYLLTTPEVEVDFLTLEMAKSQYVWTDRKQHASIVNQFDRNVEIIAINPDTLYFKYDVNFVKTVPIIIKSQLNYAVGFDLLDNLASKPDSVKIIGPKVLIDTITHINTEVLDLKELNAPIAQKVNLELPLKNQQIIYSHQSTKVIANIVKFTEGTLEIPIEVVNVPKNVKLSYFPKTVKLIFYTSLKNFKTISAQDFRIECDFKATDNTSGFLKPKIVGQPNTIKNARLSTDNVEYIIRQQ
jgi:hypothetical protein